MNVHEKLGLMICQSKEECCLQWPMLPLGSAVVKEMISSTFGVVHYTDTPSCSPIIIVFWLKKIDGPSAAKIYFHHMFSWKWCGGSWGWHFMKHKTSVFIVHSLQNLRQRDVWKNCSNYEGLTTHCCFFSADSKSWLRWLHHLAIPE